MKVLRAIYVAQSQLMWRYVFVIIYSRILSHSLNRNFDLLTEASFFRILMPFYDVDTNMLLLAGKVKL